MQIFESIIDQTLNFYSPYVFTDYKSDNPKLKDGLRKKIIKDVESISQIINVKDFFIKGSILTKKYSNRSDIDVLIITDDEIEFSQIKPYWEKIDNKKFKDNPHPLQYYISTQEYNFDNTDAAYDVKNNKWIKSDQVIDIDIHKYLSEFQEWINKFSDFSEEIREDLIDYDILVHLPKKSLNNLTSKIQTKLKEIEDSAQKLVQTYNQLRDYRNASFQEEMTPSELKKYGHKTALPGNVIYKLIEKYYYKALAQKVKDILGSENYLNQNKLEKLNKLLKPDFQTESIAFKTLFEKDIFGRTEHRQQKLTAGLSHTTNRKSLGILPKYQRKSPNQFKKKTENLKSGNRSIKVDPNSSYGKYLIRKYRISNPTGEKIVGGNEHSSGIKIIFINN